MKTTNVSCEGEGLLASCCRYCYHYTPVGRRGGECHQLGVPVQANWKACSLALRPFAPSWESVPTSAPEVAIVAQEVLVTLETGQ